MRERIVSILDVNFTHTTMAEMVERLNRHINEREKAFVITANPEIVMKAYQDRHFNEITKTADYVIADGIGVVKAAQLLGNPLPERVAGYDLMHNLLKVMNEEGRTLYMLGAKEDVLQKAMATVGELYPNVQMVGSHHGFFELDDTSIPDNIKACDPDLVLVALGYPRQENWISRYIDQFQKGVFIGVGGSFDGLAGHVPRAPEMWQKMNLEWFYRLLQQPSRWRRMLALPHFVIKVVGQKLKGTPSK
jgi:N-acetylglucosaminyldiphosphoundecaprenol N-acetyl-beta-D-mannosaminyltransferase